MKAKKQRLSNPTSLRIQKKQSHQKFALYEEASPNKKNEEINDFLRTGEDMKQWTINISDLNSPGSINLIV
jgi:hypothetical protein